jgi:hypothetical protein
MERLLKSRKAVETKRETSLLQFWKNKCQTRCRVGTLSLVWEVDSPPLGINLLEDNYLVQMKKMENSNNLNSLKDKTI